MAPGHIRGNISKTDRQTSKPLMEKRRRERINKSLNDLKQILLEALRRDTTCHSKLEKADILEMTVRYLRSIRTRQGGYPSPTSTPYNPENVARFKNSFSPECRTSLTAIISVDEQKSGNFRDTIPRIPGYSELQSRQIRNVMTVPNFSQFMTPNPEILTQQIIKREPNSTANSNDSESDSDNSCTLLTENNILSSSTVLTETCPQTWRPW